MQLHETILKAANAAWENSANLHITFEVMDKNGKFHEDINYPYGTERDMADGSKHVLINISVNACKQFVVDPETGDFIYDVAVGGKGFFGNIPIKYVRVLFDMDGDRPIYWQQPRNVVVYSPYVCKPITDEQVAKMEEDDNIKFQEADAPLAVSDDKMQIGHQHTPAIATKLHVASTNNAPIVSGKPNGKFKPSIVK